MLRFISYAMCRENYSTEQCFFISFLNTPFNECLLRRTCRLPSLENRIIYKALTNNKIHNAKSKINIYNNPCSIK